MSFKESLMPFFKREEAFSPETQDALQKENIILPLTGQSIHEIIRDCNVLFSDIAITYLYCMSPDTLDARSHVTQVAFNPLQFILPQSDKQPYAQQLQMIKQQSRKLRGARLEILQAPEYMEILVKYYEQTEKCLLEQGQQIRTATAICGGQNCDIAMGPRGIYFNFSYRDIGWENVYLAPVYMPR